MKPLNLPTRRSKFKNIVYEIDENPKPKKCKLVSDGHKCLAKIMAHGLCHGHLQRLKQHGLMGLVK